MLKKILLVLLFVSLLFEAYQTVMCFIDPTWALKMFDVVDTTGTRTLTQILAWFLLLTTALIGLAMFWIYKSRREGLSLSLVLGLFWVGIGIGIYLVGGVSTNLIFDSAKGALLIALVLSQRPVKNL